MQSGNISFDRLFEHIKRHPEIPHKDELPFLDFKALYLQLIQHVADIPGWYAWAELSDGSDAKCIYIGQSQSRTTSSLRARLKEEFLDEFVALWCTVHGNGQADILCRKYRGKYDVPIKRSARKTGSTHIIWFGKRGLTDQQLNVIEHALIARHKPSANKQSRIHADSFEDLMNEADAALKLEFSKLT